MHRGSTNRKVSFAYKFSMMSKGAYKIVIWHRRILGLFFGRSTDHEFIIGAQAIFAAVATFIPVQVSVPLVDIEDDTGFIVMILLGQHFAIWRLDARRKIMP